MENVDTILAGQPFLKGVDKTILTALKECCSFQQFESGKFIFRQNQQANHFYFILEGKVDVELFSASGGPVVLQSLQKGEVLGWSWLIAPHQWRMDARSVEFTRTLALDAKLLRSKMEMNHDLGYELTKRFLVLVSQRLESARLELLSLYAAHS